LAKGPIRLDTTPLDQLADLADKFTQSATTLKGRQAKKARARIAEVVDQLRTAMAGLDPIGRPSSIFDPSNPRTVGLFVSIALVAQKREPLGEVQPYYGSGVYAIYYKGDFPAYKQLVRSEHPIYVGKADPAVPDAKTGEEQGLRLARRLRDHAKAIQRAPNLRIEDFTCRQLVVASGLQTAAESYLINLFKPLWNKEVKIAFGIGKHGDAPTTRANLRSPWDTLHHGRAWAHRDTAMKDQAPVAEIISKIARHLEQHPPFKNIDQVLHRFYEDLKQR
jgi:hypothetical protein